MQKKGFVTKGHKIKGVST